MTICDMCFLDGNAQIPLILCDVVALFFVQLKKSFIKFASAMVIARGSTVFTKCKTLHLASLFKFEKNPNTAELSEFF